MYLENREQNANHVIFKFLKCFETKPWTAGLDMWAREFGSCSRPKTSRRFLRPYDAPRPICWGLVAPCSALQHWSTIVLKRLKDHTSRSFADVVWFNLILQKIDCQMDIDENRIVQWLLLQSFQPQICFHAAFMDLFYRSNSQNLGDFRKVGFNLPRKTTWKLHETSINKTSSEKKKKKKKKKNKSRSSVTGPGAGWADSSIVASATVTRMKASCRGGGQPFQSAAVKDVCKNFLLVTSLHLWVAKLATYQSVAKESPCTASLKWPTSYMMLPAFINLELYRTALAHECGQNVLGMPKIQLWLYRTPIEH